jgi:hypothetical protein
MAKNTNPSCEQPRDPVGITGGDERDFGGGEGGFRHCAHCQIDVRCAMRCAMRGNISVHMLPTLTLRVVLYKISKADIPRLGWRMWMILDGLG